MKEKNNIFSKRIFILILLIILLLTSTYAWFTINRNVRVETLNVQVATSGNLEISADAINWKTAIDTEDLLDNIHITYPNAKNQIPKDGLYPMSTSGIVNNGKIDMFFGTVKLDNETSKYNLTAIEENIVHGTNGKYISFDIFFRIAEDTTIHLNSASSIKSEDIKNINESTGIENATRIAILNQGTAATASVAQRLNGAKKSIIIEPNYDIHTETGIQNAKYIYGISELKRTGNRALPYYGIKTEITDRRPINDTSSKYFELVNPEIKLEKNFFENQTTKRELLKINKGITKVRLYLWVEGQDVDCEDNASGANLKFDLQFTT